MIRFRQEDGNGGRMEDEGAPALDTDTTPDPPAYGGPSQEEWQQAQQTIQQLTGLVPTVQQMARYFEQQPPEDDPQEFDIEDYIQQQVEQRLAPIMPVVTTAAQRSGEERMKTIFDEEKKELGDFDYKLAERAAHSFFQETGDPIGSVKEGAKYAAEVRKAERSAGREEYKKSLQRGPHDLDPDVKGGGNRSIPAAKSYDEVIERYAGTDDL